MPRPHQKKKKEEQAEEASVKKPFALFRCVWGPSLHRRLVWDSNEEKEDSRLSEAESVSPYLPHFERHDKTEKKKKKKDDEAKREEEEEHEGCFLSAAIPNFSSFFALFETDSRLRELPCLSFGRRTKGKKKKKIRTLLDAEENSFFGLEKKKMPRMVSVKKKKKKRDLKDLG